MLLIAFASDAGFSDEAVIHLEALPRMVTERGGLAVLEAEVAPLLRLQLQSLRTTSFYHLTLGCTTDCTGEPRFIDEEGILTLLASSES